MENILSFYKDYVSGVGNEDLNQGCDTEATGLYDSSTNAVYAVLFEDDTLWRVNYHVCYGRLNELSAYKTGTPVAVFVQLQLPLLEKYNFTTEMQLTYYEWLFNYSPYRSVFITKDHAQAVRDSVVVLDAKAEANLLVGACSAIRCPWEDYFYDYKIPSIAQLWYELVAEGNDPTIAMALANNFSGDGSWSFRGTTAGHQFLSVNDPDTIVNFITDNRTVTSPFNVIKRTDDVGITGVWSRYSSKNHELFGGNVQTWLTNRIEGVSGKAVNPFGKTSTSKYFKLPALKEGLGVAAKELKEALHV